ncbi:hypothetical protein DKG75_05815 [Zavarzinia compransoris]|uniref:Uncharacterized protein n=2 Tax=Zavarzinia compransoris TaxID=1264899 RepID=A0A317E8S2_9PROT|nr:hypothetical protein DKG75_05815 [Zavarzinia compransoris]
MASAARQVQAEMFKAGYTTYLDPDLDDRLVREYLDGRREFIAYLAPEYSCVVLGVAPPVAPVLARIPCLGSA